MLRGARHVIAAGVTLGCLLVSPPFLFSQEQDLSTASLEDLTHIQIRVSSFARKEADLWKTPAPVFVISKEDIARSSASSIPELLRIVPGIQVAQLDASTWAISARGFNSEYAAKVLVLVDGRTVYSEIYSGTHWDEIDLPLEDIERIEVVRGPGGAVWGADAVNGVINIITKRSRVTLGSLVSGSLSRIGNQANLRYGGPLGRAAQYRVFANYTDRQPFDLVSGQRAFDGEDVVRAGGRVDWQRSLSDWITTSGDLYGGRFKQQTVAEIALPIGPDGHDGGWMDGGYVLSRWEHKSTASDMATQIYFDDQTRHELGSSVRTLTLDLDYQDHQVAGSRNDIVWGGEFRLTADALTGPVLPTTRPHYRNYLLDGFVQDEITVVPKNLYLTLGSKIQTGTLAGFEVQPSARILWSPGANQSFWAAVSRAAVAPSIEDRFLQLPLNLGVENGLPVLGDFLGNLQFLPETVLAYELGCRQRIGNAWTLDIATFINDTRRLQATGGTPVFVPTPSPHIQDNLFFVNGYRARSTGVEGSVLWKPEAAFSMQLSYTRMQAHLTQTAPGDVSLSDSFNSPRNALAATASWSFAKWWSANGFLSYTGDLPASGDGVDVPSYTRLDLHMTRQLGRSIAFDAGGTNLLTPRHLEFGNVTGLVTPAYVPRSLFVKATWTF